MPTVEIVNLKQKAVLWERAGWDGEGSVKLSSPVEIDVRWEEVNKQTTDSQGGAITIEAEVDCEMPILVGSILWQGKLTDLPTPVTNLKEVIRCTKVPDIKGRKIKYAVLLAKLSDSLPTVVP